MTSPPDLVIPASPANTLRRECVGVIIFNDLISEETESFSLLLQGQVDISPLVTEVFIMDDDGMEL